MNDWILRNRWLILIVLIAATIPFITSIPKIERNAGISALVPEHHPDYIFSNEMEDLFGATDQIVIGVNYSDGIYTKEAITLIQNLTNFFLDRDDLEEDDILSLTTVDEMKGANGELVIEPLVDVDSIEDLDEVALDKIRTGVKSNPMYDGKLVSLDDKSAVVLVGVPGDISLNEDSLERLKQETIDRLARLEGEYPGVSFDFSGPVIMKAYIAEYMLKDLKTLFPIAIVVVAVLIAIFLKSIAGTIVPILVTLFAVIWTFGLKSLIHSPITIVETAIPVALIAIACADGIHIVSDFLAHRKTGLEVRASVNQTMRVLALPVILTSVTTGLGFISLISAPGVSIKNMGIFLAFGVLVAMVFSLLFIPAMLTLFRPIRNKSAAVVIVKKTEHQWFEKKAESFGYWIINRKVWMVLIGAILLVLSVLGIMNIEIESDEVRYLKRSNPFRKATEDISKRLGGITSLDVIVQSEDPDYFKQPGALKAIESLQKYAENEELVSYSLSITDLVRRLNYVLHDSQSSYDRVPNEIEQVPAREGDGFDEIAGKSQISQYLLLYELSGGDAISGFVDTAYQTAKVSLRLKDMSSQKLDALVRRIESYSEGQFPENVSVRFTNHYMRVVMMNLIIESQIYSLITVLVTIFVLMSLIFRSPVIGVFTALPVVIAVLFNFTIMWIFGVTLNIGTSIIASVGMGVGIDYAIHYYSRFRVYIKAGEEYIVAIVLALSKTSRSILTNAFAVGLGFLVLLFSEYGVIANIGWIIALTMLTTALGSLVIMPALLAIFKPKVR